MSKALNDIKAARYLDTGNVSSLQHMTRHELIALRRTAVRLGDRLVFVARIDDALRK